MGSAVPRLQENGTCTRSILQAAALAVVRIPAESARLKSHVLTDGFGRTGASACRCIWTCQENQHGPPVVGAYATWRARSEMTCQIIVRERFRFPEARPSPALYPQALTGALT